MSKFVLLSFKFDFAYQDLFVIDSKNYGEEDALIPNFKIIFSMIKFKVQRFKQLWELLSTSLNISNTSHYISGSLIHAVKLKAELC